MLYGYDYIKKYNEEFLKAHKREIKQLSKDEQQVMNHVMYGADERFSRNSKYPTWRLFQIVFIVLQIRDIVESDYQRGYRYDCF